MIAFHYPPCRTSSGYLRAEKFVRYLPEFGWSPQVLTARVSVYGDGSIDTDSPPASVHRAFAFDARENLSIRGKYFAFLTLPDRWWSWLPTATWRGMSLLKRTPFQVVWSTYPIPTALLVGFAIKRLSGCSWVVDLRDPMIDEVHPTGRFKRWLFGQIESLAIKRSDLVVVTTPGARQLYLSRYSNLKPSKIICIGNGFDEEDFESLTSASACEKKSAKLKLVHSGTLYPKERNPLPFLNALAQLKNTGVLSDHPFEVVLRASGHDEWLQQEIAKRDLDEWICVAPAIDYRQALKEMVDAHGLILFQADNCQAQIPAKLYEYLRAGNPIFALVDAAGDTANLLKEGDTGLMVDLMDEEAIIKQWSVFIKQLAIGKLPLADSEWVSGLSRRHRAKQLATTFDQLVYK